MNATPVALTQANETAATGLGSGKVVAAAESKPGGQLAERPANTRQTAPNTLRQAGVELCLERADVEGRPAIILTLLEVNFCPMCQTFYDTKEQHTCNR